MPNVIDNRTDSEKLQTSGFIVANHKNKDSKKRTITARAVNPDENIPLIMNEFIKDDKYKLIRYIIGKETKEGREYTQKLYKNDTLYMYGFNTFNKTVDAFKLANEALDKLSQCKPRNEKMLNIWADSLTNLRDTIRQWKAEIYVKVKHYGLDLS